MKSSVFQDPKLDQKVIICPIMNHLSLMLSVFQLLSRSTGIN